MAIGSSDGATIDNSHLGDTRVFRVYDVFSANEYKFIESRDNAVQDMDHATGDKMRAVIQTLHDAQVLVSAKNSPNFKKMAESTPVQPVVVATNDITQALALVQENFAQIQSMVTSKVAGARDLGVLILG